MSAHPSDIAHWRRVMVIDLRAPMSGRERRWVVGERARAARCLRAYGLTATPDERAAFALAREALSVPVADAKETP